MSVLAILAAGSSVGLRSPSMSATGGAATGFGAVREPAVSSVNSLTEMMSIGIGVGSAAGGLAAKVNAAHTSTTACTAIDTPRVQTSRRLVDIVCPALIDPDRGLPHAPSWALLNLRDECDAVEPRARQPPHDLHDGTIVNLAIAAHIDALINPA